MHRSYPLPKVNFKSNVIKLYMPVVMQDMVIGHILVLGVAHELVHAALYKEQHQNWNYRKLLVIESARTPVLDLPRFSGR